MCWIKKKNKTKLNCSLFKLLLALDILTTFVAFWVIESAGRLFK